jgi:hypothetical protein
VQKSTLLKVFFIIKKGIVSLGLGHWLSICQNFAAAFGRTSSL